MYNSPHVSHILGNNIFILVIKNKLLTTEIWEGKKKKAKTSKYQIYYDVHIFTIFKCLDIMHINQFYF